MNIRRTCGHFLAVPKDRKTYVYSDDKLST